VAAWAVIGTCTAVSRSIQIWVTSNIVRGPDGDVDGMESEQDKGPGPVARFMHAFAVAVGGGNPEEDSDEGEVPVVIQPQLESEVEVSEAEGSPMGRRRRRGKKGRRWDWKEVCVKCVLPTGLAYLIMAWAEVGRREYCAYTGSC